MAFDSYEFVAGSMIDMRSYASSVHSHIFGFNDIFETSDELGAGAQGTVLQCTSKEHQGRTYAAKVIRTNKLVPKMMAMLEYELKLLNNLNCEAQILCPKIVQTFHAYASTDCTHIVMEHMMGGTLTQWRAQRESHSVTELETRVICRSLFEALQFCHERNIAHRDIKLSNLLLARPNDLSSLKIGDFGFAKVVPPTGLTTRCGTPLFLPPEIVLLGSELYKSYDTKCDIWSAGVVVYILLGGLPPFTFGPEKHRNIHSLYKEIIFGDIGLDKPIWDIVSHEAKDMIRGMMTRDHGYRWSAKDVIECKWMNTSDTGKWGSSLIFRSMVFDEESCVSLMPFDDAKNSNVTVPVCNVKQDSDSSMTQEKNFLPVHIAYPQDSDDSMIQEKVLLEQQVAQMHIQVDRRQGLTKSSRVPSTKDRTTQVLQLSLSAKGLKNISSLMHTSDPFAVVNIRGDNPDNKPIVIGQTNVVFNNLSPKWSTIVFIDGYQPGVPFYFEVGIFDFDAKETDISERELQLHDSHKTHDLVAESLSRKLLKNESFPHRVIGTAIFEVGEILASRDHDGRRPLQTGGEVYAQLEPCCEDTQKREFTFRLRAFNIKNRQSLVIKSTFNLFFEISRKQDRLTGATWIKVYQSHVISNCALPIWNQVQLDIRAVCNGDLNRAIKIILWDHRWSGEHVYMGEFETTVNGLMYAKLSAEESRETDVFHVKKKGKVTGTCEVLNASIQYESSSQRRNLEHPQESDAPLEISLPGTPALQQFKTINSHIYLDSE